MYFPQQKEKLRSAAILITGIILALCLLISGQANASDAAGDFPDAPRDQWYGDAVYACVDKGYVHGFEDGTFKPNDPITYAQLATMICDDVYATTSFANETSTDQPWWYPGVYTCQQAGALDGTVVDATDSGSVNAPITRYEMAQIISNVVKGRGFTGGDAEMQAASGKITDWDAVPANYKDAVARCYALGIISGFQDGSFGGGQALTRAQVCVIMVGMDEAIAERPPVDPDTLTAPITVTDSDDDALYDVDTEPLGTAPKPSGSTVASTATGSKTKVGYGTGNYPNLTSIDYGTYRKVDYQRVDGKATYLYHFRNDWTAGAYARKGEPTSLASGYAGYYGITASTDKNTLTYTAYTELDNVTVKAVQFRTFDNAQSIDLEAAPNEEHTCRTGNLQNGPYILGAWFDYTDGDGKTTTVSIGHAVYVSNGYGYFADYVDLEPSADIKAWLSDNRNDIAADDALQAWVDEQGGNDLKKTTDLSAVAYPFKSGTSRYPNETSKWQGLAHEICPDKTEGDYTKAAKLFVWMRSNLAYDRDALTATTNGDYRWATAAANSSAKGFTTWDSHIGMCLDFSNIYAIMCRELGIPCHIVSVPGHGYNIAYLHGHWEIIDTTNGMRKASVGTDNKAFVANAKAYWAKQKTGDDYTAISWYAFGVSVKDKLGVADYETSKYATIEQKLADQLDKLDLGLGGNYQGYYKGIYNH